MGIRFYFHTDNDELDLDDEGTELRDLEQARMKRSSCWVMCWHRRTVPLCGMVNPGKYGQAMAQTAPAACYSHSNFRQVKRQRMKARRCFSTMAQPHQFAGPFLNPSLNLAICTAQKLVKQHRCCACAISMRF